MLRFLQADDVEMVAVGRPSFRPFGCLAFLFLLLGAAVLLTYPEAPERYGVAGVFWLPAVTFVAVGKRSRISVRFHRPSRSYWAEKVAGADPPRAWEGRFDEFETIEWREDVLVLRGVDEFLIHDEEGVIGAKLVEWILEEG